MLPSGKTFGDTCFRVLEKRTSFPLSEGCCSRTPEYGSDHGRPQGGKNGHLPPLEIGTKKQKFLENVKSAV